MNTKYQVIHLGLQNIYYQQIIDTLRDRVNDIGMSYDLINVLTPENFENEYRANAPTVALYFGGVSATFPDQKILNRLISDATLVLPIVSDLNDFMQQIPTVLQPINGFELSSQQKVEALVGRILEGLNLLRLSRRLFISYKRSESTGVAIQLYERLEQSGFDVFLDTHSIRQGEVFQEELWHRLVDTDVVVLLNTKGFLESEWTQQELAKASALSIGILQLIWPAHTPERSSELCIPNKLEISDFEDGLYTQSKATLTGEAVSKIVNLVESLRARSLGARQDNIITEFMKTSTALGIQSHLQPEKFITIPKKDGTEIIVIPTIGVPHAFTYNQSQELVKAIRAHHSDKIFLLFDHINIREKWLNHLEWLNTYLPLETVKTIETQTWLKNLNL